MTIFFQNLRVFLLGVFTLATLLLQAQEPERFKKEVDEAVALNQTVDRKNLIVFTGSSSIRMWNDLKQAFPEHNIINLGFGGSEMLDLLYYVDKLIIDFKPKQVFIYEGDNDVSKGRSAEEIISAAEKVLLRIREQLPDTEVVFISPKPSVSRWHLKEKYEEVNSKLKAWTETKTKVRYADVWTPMLDDNGQVMKDLFIADNLHMNKKGYQIWTEVLANYLR
jgi:lysophospholipase L1-like esterase